MSVKTYFVRFFWMSALCLSASATAGTAVRELDYPRSAVFDATKRYVVLQLSKPAEAQKSIELEDASAGIIRFFYRDEQNVKAVATAEIIELEGEKTKLKVTLPADFGGRAELMAQKLAQAVADEHVPTNKDPLPIDATKVYRSVLRHILKTYLTGKLKKDDVIRFASEEIGTIRFVYRNREFTEPDAKVIVLSPAKGSSRIVVSFASGSSHQLLLEDELVAAVKGDLGMREPDAPSENPDAPE